MEAEAEAEAEVEAMPSEMVKVEAEAEAILFKMLEEEVEADASNFQICQLEAEAEAIQKSTASASLVPMLEWKLVGFKALIETGGVRSIEIFMSCT